ncbi:hypothetical protein RNAN_0637 [Rheinheimera nanhaiensis E407-8]|uniref:Uncharacterized protein n=1 Tax=Rheinheimera nanhaiensis E407-8 TaxID=562729 RepID=I1DUE0_9GAMM|nr:hypothetical protein RNAN_0637 [Rheinheimera nanhaiensis E407-8]
MQKKFLHQIALRVGYAAFHCGTRLSPDKAGVIIEEFLWRLAPFCP